MKKFQHLDFGLEAIDAQDGKLFRELTILVEDTDFTSHTGRTQFAESLSSITERGLGFKIKTDWTMDGGFYIIFPMMSVHNPALPPMYAEWFDPSDEIKSIKKATERLATVDLKSSKLSGVWATFTPSLALDPSWLAKKINTPEEVAAICLHEFGHYFTMCELLDRTVYTNVILGTVDKVLKHGQDVSKREQIIDIAGKAFDMDETAISDLKKSTSDKAVATILLTSAVGSCRSANGNSYYDVTTMEFLADQFATRHGAGKHVATGLDKIYNYYGVNHRRPRQASAVLDVIRMATSFCCLMLAVTAAAGILVAFLWLLAAFLFAAGGLSDTPVHNTAKERVLRIKRDLIQQAKFNVSPERAKEIALDVAFLDDLASKYTTDDYVSMVDRIWLFLSKGRRDDKAIEAFQRELEALAANDLFVKSLELQHNT